MLILPFLVSVALALVPSTEKYTIQDILSRYQNLSGPSREIHFFRNTPELGNTCVRSALDPILSQCLKKSINDLDPQLRAHTAAKLSICEFEVAGVEYPAECQTRAGFFFGQDSVDFAGCVVAMERKSQWWTTYSGYYRSIGEMCLQESLPYEKDEIWNLFLGVTEHYDNLFSVLKGYVAMSEKFKEESETSFVVMREFMEEIKDNSEKNKEKMDVIWSVVSQQMEQLSEMTVNVTELAREQTDTLEHNIFDFLNSIDVQFSEELDSLRQRFTSDLEERDQLMQLSIEQTRLRLQQLHDLSRQNNALGYELQDTLQSTLDSAHSLNSSLEEMDESVGGLTQEINTAKDLMDSFTGVLENNVLVRAMVFMSRDFALSVESILVFGSFSCICFVSFLLISWRVNLFKYVGIFVVSLMLGSFIGTVFMLVGRVVNQELERQLAANSTTLVTT